MNVSKQCQYYACYLNSKETEMLVTIDPHNTDFIALFLAASICHVQNKYRLCIKPVDQQTVLSSSVYTLVSGTYCGIPRYKALVLLAIARYQAEVVPQLGGHQTPRISNALEEVLKSIEVPSQSQLNWIKKPKHLLFFGYVKCLIYRMIIMKSRKKNNGKN